MQSSGRLSQTSQATGVRDESSKPADVYDGTCVLCTCLCSLPTRSEPHQQVGFFMPVNVKVVVVVELTAFASQRTHSAQSDPHETATGSCQGNSDAFAYKCPCAI